MKNVTLRIDEDMVETLDEEADEHGQSRSEYMREILATRNEDSALEDECKQLQSQVDDLQTELERVHREKRQILEQREENTELVEYVEQEKSLSQQRATAGVLTRARWWLTGMPDE